MIATHYLCRRITWYFVYSSRPASIYFLFYFHFLVVFFFPFSFPSVLLRFLAFIVFSLIQKTPKTFICSLRLVFFSPHLFFSLVFWCSCFFVLLSLLSLCVTLFLPLALFVCRFLKTRKQQKDFLVFSLFHLPENNKNIFSSSCYCIVVCRVQLTSMVTLALYYYYLYIIRLCKLQGNNDDIWWSGRDQKAGMNSFLFIFVHMFIHMILY